MTGLEKIIEQIRCDAKTASEHELEKTKKEVEQILAAGLQERKRMEQEFLKETESEVELLLRRGESSAALQKKKILLQEKQEVIQTMLEQSKERILNLDVEEYFSLLLDMLQRYGANGDGQLLLSERDLSRVPEFFLEELNHRNITLSKESCKIDGGFLLSYGDVQENCSIDALFSANKEQLQDKIGALIFTN